MKMIYTNRQLSGKTLMLRSKISYMTNRFYMYYGKLTN